MNFESPAFLEAKYKERRVGSRLLNSSLNERLLFKCNFFLYQMFLFISGHGKWSVRDVNSLVLVRFKGHKQCSSPPLALNERSDAATLICGVEYRQGLGLRAAHWAKKIHHLERKRAGGGQNYVIT